MNKAYKFNKNDLDDRKECVERILSTAIEQAKISMLLPRFFEDYREVSKRLRHTEYKDCAKELRIYCESHSNLTQRTKAQNYRDKDLLHLIETFQINYGMLSYFNDWLGDISTLQCAFITEISIIKDTAKEHFGKNAVPQLKNEQNLSLIFYENENVRKGLQSMARMMNKNRNSIRWRMAARESIPLEMARDLEVTEGRRKEVLRAERRELSLRAHPRQFMQREMEAVENLQLANASFVKTSAVNAKEEFVARSERNKWQIQLQLLLKKYDQTLSDKFRENLLMDERFAELKAENDEFMEIYKRAEKVYNDIIMAKKLEEHHRRWLKFKAFIENRAARIIQLWYRAYLRIYKPELLPQPAKEKGKKGKKGR